MRQRWDLIEALLELDDKELADVVEHVFTRRAFGYEETFSHLTRWELLVARVKNVVVTWAGEMGTSHSRAGVSS